jgi:hypothetical protein
MSFIDDQKDKINAAINEHKNSAFSYVENVQKLKDNFNKEVSDTYKDIIGETLGPSFKALIHILTQAFSGIAVNYINSAASVLAGTISTANSFLTLSMLSSRGIDIILRYKAAKALQESLQTRLKLSNALYVDIQQTLETLNKLSKLKSSLADTYFQNLNLALNHINAASLIIGKERSKTNIVRGTDDNGNPNRAGYVNSRNLEAAIYNIDKAVEYLLSGNIDTNDFLFDIKQLNRKYGVRTKAPLVLGSNPIVAANYMASSVRELYEKQGKDRAFEYISDYVALSPTATYLRGLAGVKYFGAYYSTLGRKLPVDSFLVVGTGAQNLVAKASTALGNNAISVNTV